MHADRPATVGACTRFTGVRTLRDLILLFAALCGAAVAAGPQTVANPDLAVDGTTLVLRLADGRELRGAQLQGAIVHLALGAGRVTALRMDTITPDPEDARILRYEFRKQDASGAWIPACPPNYEGGTWGTVMALPEGHPGRLGPITLACSYDAVGKCARWGYQPWSKGPNGEALTSHHAACVRMVTADYCGNGTPHTRDGTSIDYWDRTGIAEAGSLDDAEYALEAGWSPSGAVCVAKSRWPDQGSAAQMVRECPRLPAPETCTEESARAGGALLFNRSRVVPR